MSLAPQDWVQTLIQRDPYTRCVTARPGLNLLGLEMGIQFLLCLTLRNDVVLHVFNCQVSHNVPSQALMIFTCSPYSEYNLKAFGMIFVVTFPLTLIRTHSPSWLHLDFSDTKWTLHIFFPINAAVDPMSQAWWIKPFSALHFFFLFPPKGFLF